MKHTPEEIFLEYLEQPENDRKSFVDYLNDKGYSIFDESPPPSDWQEWIKENSLRATRDVEYPGSLEKFGINCWEAGATAMLPFIEELKEGEAKQLEYATKYFDENTQLRQRIEEKEKEIERLKDIVMNRDECIYCLEQQCGEYAERLLKIDEEKNGISPF